jgi:hypothetical protein
MVEVVCPLCDEEIDLESDATGEYECPYCEGSFGYESELYDFDQIEQYIDEIEKGIIEADFIIKDYSYTDEVYWKYIRLILSIPFILLFGIGLIFIYFILQEPFETEHFVDRIIYHQDSDLIIFYKTRNGIVRDYNYLEIADDALLRFSTMSVESGSGVISEVTITCRSKKTNDNFRNVDSYWREFAEYRGLRCVGN